MEKNNERFILHIMLCGFHHKKGGILEFVYPPLYGPEENKNPLELPPEWANIPSLALPEGAHNYESDSVYFHVESRTKPTNTIFGLSTYRQIDAKSVVNKSSEVTRSCVQKSVCLLCTLPLYGILKTKLDSITHSFFAGCDFSKTELLVATYDQLDAASRNIAALSGGGGDDLFVDVDLLSAYISYQADILAIFKLLLLERRVLLTISPASRMANTILALLSLIPGTVRYGLFKAVLNSNDRLAAETDSESLVVKPAPPRPLPPAVASVDRAQPQAAQSNDTGRARTLSRSVDNLSVVSAPTSPVIEDSSTKELKPSGIQLNLPTRSHSERSDRPSIASAKSWDDLAASSADSSSKARDKFSYYSRLQTEEKPAKTTSLAPPVAVSHPPAVAGSTEVLDLVRASVSEYLLSLSSTASQRTSVRDRVADALGFPLVLFDTKLADSFCLPYACLHDLSWLLKTRARSFLVGCNNPLFTMPSAVKIYDAIVDDSKMKLLKSDLSKLLKMTSADLRFLDRLEVATRPRRAHARDEHLFDSTNWEGSDDWIREQFRVYLVQLLRAAQNPDTNATQDFGVPFVKAFRQTTVFQCWDALAQAGRIGSEIENYPPLHPSATADSFNSLTSDVKLQVNHYLQSSEHGKKVHATLSVMNEGLNRGKQLVSSKLASFLGFGKEAKPKKDDRRDSPPSAAVCDQSEADTKVPNDASPTSVNNNSNNKVDSSSGAAVASAGED